MIIKTWKDPYDAGFTPTAAKEIELKPGLTVLVGCNGAGKTTLIMNIEESCKDNNIPCHVFDNLKDGGYHDMFGTVLSGMYEFEDDSLDLAISMMNSSEGECIKLNIGRQSTKYKEFIKTGYFNNRQHRLSKLFYNEKLPNIVEDNRRVLLFDATDSGMSIDTVCDIKELFKLILQDAKDAGVEFYIIISANEYELCRNEKCFNVNSGKYLTFSDYKDYRRFILNSRKIKDKRIDNQIKWRKKKRVKAIKEYIKLKNECDYKKQKLLEQFGDKKLCWKEKRQLEEIDAKLKNFIKYNKYINKEDITQINNK